MARMAGHVAAAITQQVGPGRAVATRPRADAAVYDPRDARALQYAAGMAAVAADLAGESWAHRHRKVLATFKVAVVLGISRALVHTPQLPAKYATLSIALLVVLTVGLLFTAPKLTIVTVMAGAGAAVAASPYLPLGGVLLALPLLVGSCWWLPQTGRRPTLPSRPDWLDRIEQPKAYDAAAWCVRRARPLSRPVLGATATVAAASAWWASWLDGACALLTRWSDSLGWAAPYLALTAGTLVVAAVRVVRFRVRDVVEGEVVYHPSREDDWYEYVETDKRAAGTVIKTIEDVAAPDGSVIGFAMVAEWPRNSDGPAPVMNGLRERIKNAYDVGPTDVLMELHPKKARIARVTVLTMPNGNALADAVVWDGTTEFSADPNDPGAGMIVHSIRADWGQTWLRLWQPNFGCFHGHFSGGTGGGKTRGLDLYVRKCTQHGIVVPLFVDLGGADFVPWKRHSPVFVGKRDDMDDPDENDMLSALAAVQFLKNLQAEGQRRQKLLGELRVQDPRIEALPVTDENPILMVVFEEWQFGWSNFDFLPPARYLAITDGLTIKMALLKYTKQVMTQVRKVNISVNLAGQEIGLVEGFANIKSIRSQAQMGNMAAYRSSTEAGEQAFGGGLNVDPSTIPAPGGGLNFTASPVQAVDAMNRGFWVQETYEDRLDIPELSVAALQLLTRNLADGWLDLDAFPDATPADAPAPAWADVPAVVVGPPAVTTALDRPTLTSVPAPPSLRLRLAMWDWLDAREAKGLRTRRADFVSEFSERRITDGVQPAGSRSKVDGALTGMKRDREVDADSSGFYTTVRNPREGVA